MVMAGKKRVVFICFHDRVNLGLRILFAKLKQRGHEPFLIFVKDERASSIPEPKEDAVQYQILSNDRFIGCGQDVNPITVKEWSLLTSLIKDLEPQIIGISSRSVHKELAFSAVQYLRKVAPTAVFLGGGYGPILEPQQYLQHFDYICIGEADDAIVPFVEATNFRSVANIAFMEDGKFVYNQILPPCDLDKSPYPDWSDTNKFMIEDEAIKSGKWFSHPKVYDVLASRGCISTCTYCMACQWSKMLKPFGASFPKARLRSPDSVIDELRVAKEKYGVRVIRFKDSIFGFNEEWLFKFLDRYDKQIGLPFLCFLDVRYSSERVIKRLRTSGLSHTTVGIQSANDAVRRSIFDRNIADADIVTYAEHLLRNGIQVKYELINWNPFEDHLALEKGLHFLARLPKASRINVLELKIFPGSLLEDKYNRQRPTPLLHEEYTFMAILQVMVLFSKATEEMAFSLLKEGNHNWKHALDVFRKHLLGAQNGYRVVASRNIGKGEQITREALSLKKVGGEGISYAEKEKVIDLIAKVPMDAGKVIRWDDIYYSYEATSTV